MYPPTCVWGTGLRGGTKAQPVPQPQLNPWIYPRVSPTRGNPYMGVHVLANNINLLLMGFRYLLGCRANPLQLPGPECFRQSLCSELCYYLIIFQCKYFYLQYS